MCFRIVAVLVIITALSACSATNPVAPSRAVEINSVRQPLEGIQTEKVTVKRSQYTDIYLRGGNINRARMVEVFTHGVEEHIKEFRLFDIQPGSVYDLLGLRTADVLIAANGFVVPDQETFWRYLWLITDKQVKPFIEIRREGSPITLQYTFVP
jgi:hypothetical protein